MPTRTLSKTPVLGDKVTVLTHRLAKIPCFKGGQQLGGSVGPLKTGSQHPKNETGYDRDKRGISGAMGGLDLAWGGPK